MNASNESDRNKKVIENTNLIGNNCSANMYSFIAICDILIWNGSINCTQHIASFGCISKYLNNIPIQASISNI